MHEFEDRKLALGRLADLIREVAERECETAADKAADLAVFEAGAQELATFADMESRRLPA